MARYIDLEELAKRIANNIKAETPEEKELIEWCKDECIRQGYAMPAADVVPRSEENKITPDFCKNCVQLSESGCCASYMKCSKWRLWFGREWKAIKEAAQLLKEN